MDEFGDDSGRERGKAVTPRLKVNVVYPPKGQYWEASLN